MKSLYILSALFLHLCFAQLPIGHGPRHLRSSSVYTPQERNYEFMGKRNEAENSVAEEEAEEAVYPHLPQLFSFALLNESASYTFFSLKFTVPPVPTNVSIQEVQFAAIAQSAVSALDGDYLGVFLDFGVDPLTEGNPGHADQWAISVCICPYFACNCSEEQYVSPGDVIDVVINLQNGQWTATGSSSNGVAVTYTREASAFARPIGLLACQYAGIGTENCNNHPPSNHIDVTDIVVKDQGVQQTNIQWSYGNTLSACSFQVNANDVLGRLAWNSNSWNGNAGGDTCALQYVLKLKSTWVADGKTYYEYNMQIDNFAWSENLTGLTFSLDPAPAQIWQVTKNTDGSYSIPAYAFPISAYWPENTFSFGFISTQRPALVNAHCQGGEIIRIGDQPGQPKSGGVVSLDDLGNNFCSVAFSQSVHSTWVGDQGATHLQVDVVMRNNGARAITALDFTSAQASSMSAWVVTSTADGHYSLPLWQPALPVGASLTFGYIIRAGQPAEFQTNQITCN